MAKRLGYIVVEEKPKDFPPHFFGVVMKAIFFI
jgi:hypothetical protein